MRISVKVNGAPRTFEVRPDERVRSLLRRENILSVRNGCDGQGSCGACTILLDGRPVNSCLLLAPQVDGHEIHTVEHQSRERTLSAIQTAFLDVGAVQCGYCTPPFLLATEALLKRHPRPTRAQVQDAFSSLLCRCTGYEQMFAAVELAAERLRDPAAAAARGQEFRDDLRLVGKPARKVDGARLLRPEKAYVEDMITPGTCHLRLLGSPHAHAYIRRIVTRRAEAMPGVVLVITHENCPDVWYNAAGQGFPEPSPYDRRMFARKVLHVGDRVAAVVAETPAVAEAALARIKVEYEVLPPVLSIEAAAAPGAPVLHRAVVEYVKGAPPDLDNRGADPRDGRVIYQFPIGGDPRRNLAALIGQMGPDFRKSFGTHHPGAQSLPFQPLHDKGLAEAVFRCGYINDFGFRNAGLPGQLHEFGFEHQPRSSANRRLGNAARRPSHGELSLSRVRLKHNPVGFLARASGQSLAG